MGAREGLGTRLDSALSSSTVANMEKVHAVFRLINHIERILDLIGLDDTRPFLLPLSKNLKGLACKIMYDKLM